MYAILYDFCLIVAHFIDYIRMHTINDVNGTKTKHTNQLWASANSKMKWISLSILRFEWNSAWMAALKLQRLRFIASMVWMFRKIYIHLDWLGHFTGLKGTHTIALSQSMALWFIISEETLTLNEKHFFSPISIPKLKSCCIKCT